MALRDPLGRGGEPGRIFGLALKAVRGIMDTAVILLFIYMVAAIFAQVIGRYVFNFSIAAAEETATFAQIWMVLFGAGIAMRRNQHVGIDILIALCPRRVQQLVTIVATAIGLWFLWVVFSARFSLMEVGKFHTSAVMQWPMNVAYLALPIGSAYFALEFLIALAPRCLGRGPSHGAERQLADEL
jgi:TRAP-type C4-dicarboxylate transport system permease small subunit